MIKKIAYFIFIASLFLMQSCYDDYQVDYEYTTTYFARQFPLRTLVNEEGKDMTFEVGVVLGGKYSNDINEDVNIIVQDTLLNAYPELIQLPESYYTLESENITIPKGKFKGSVTVTLDKEKFLNDDLAIGKNYALPLEIISTSIDSILQDKHYSIIVLRYYNERHGWYYLKGVDNKLDDSGNVVESVAYSENDLTENQDMMLETIAKDALLVHYDWDARLPKPNYNMVIAFSGESVTIEQKDQTSGITENNGIGSYNSSNRNFTLEYNYKDTAGDLHAVKDTLYYRNTELRFEEWQ